MQFVCNNESFACRSSLALGSCFRKCRAAAKCGPGSGTDLGFGRFFLFQLEIGEAECFGNIRDIGLKGNIRQRNGGNDLDTAQLCLFLT